MFIIVTCAFSFATCLACAVFLTAVVRYPVGNQPLKLAKLGIAMCGLGMIFGVIGIVAKILAMSS